MARKKSSTEEKAIADLVGVLVEDRLEEETEERLRKRLVALIETAQREVAEILSDFDPWWSGNFFAVLRDAVIAKDAATVRELSERVKAFKKGLSSVVESLLDLRARITGFPEAWGGNGSDDAE